MFEDALKDSWAYQEIWQGGKLEGKQEGLLKALSRENRKGYSKALSRENSMNGWRICRGNAIC